MEILKWGLGILGGGVFASAAYFLVWGALFGHFITNVSLALELRRARNTSSEDVHDLITTISLKKGPINALTIETLKVEIFSLSDDMLNRELNQWRLDAESENGRRRPGGIWVPQPAQTDDTSTPVINRSLNESGSLISERYVLAIWTLEKNRAENLAPTEETQYSSYSTVPQNSVCEVVVTLRGERYKSQISQSLLPRSIANVAYLMLLGRTYQPSKVYYSASAISSPAQVEPNVLDAKRRN